MRIGGISVNTIFCHLFTLRANICYAFNASHVRIPLSGRNMVAEIFWKGERWGIDQRWKRCGLFTVQGCRRRQAVGVRDSVTVKFYELLEKPRRRSLLNSFAQCCLFSCPHSMIAERAVKLNRKVVHQNRS